MWGAARFLARQDNVFRLGLSCTLPGQEVGAEAAMAIIYVTEPDQTVMVSNGDTVVIDIEGGGTVRIVANPDDNVKTFRIRFEDDTQADTAIIDLSTFSSYDLSIDVWNYDESDEVILEDAFNRGIDSSDPDEFFFEYVGDNGVTYNGTVNAKDPGERDLTMEPRPIIICFAAGTMIDTPEGAVAVETLQEGDLVVTEDNGVQPIRWVGRRTLDTLFLTRNPNLLPVRIGRGALGRNQPDRDLYVSPQHRIKLMDWRAELLFGEGEVLVPAKALVNDGDIAIEEVAQVTYVHILFDSHEIVRSNGIWTESLHPGDVAMMAIPDEAVEEIRNIFADVFDEIPEPLGNRKTARPVLKNYEVRAANGYAA
jgi:hypothetical protein